MSTRTRTRNVVSSTLTVYGKRMSSTTWLDVTDSASLRSIAPGSWSGSMTDVISNVRGSNNVTHTKVTYSAEQIPFRYQVLTGAKPWWDLYGNLGCGYLLTWAGAKHASTPDGKSLAISRIPAYAPELLDGAVSLLEAHDSVGLVYNSLTKALAKFAYAQYKAQVLSARGTKHWHANANAGVKAFKRYFLREAKRVGSPLDALKALVSSDLKYKFGVKPLLSDFNNVRAAIGRYESLSARLRKGTRLFGVVVDSNTESQTGITFSTSAFGDQYLKGDYTVTTKKVTTASVLRSLKPDTKLSELDLAMRVLKDSLGLRIDGSTIWEKIPYSFVVDYVFPFQRAIESTRGYVYPSDIFNDSDHCVTVKQTSRLSGKMYYAFCPKIQAHGSSEPKTYTRTYGVFTPSPAYVPMFRVPDFPALGTMLELAIQRLK